MSNEWVHLISDLLFPRHCLVCGQHLKSSAARQSVCVCCQRQVTSNRPPFCLVCSRHLKSPVKHPKCRSCQNNNLALNFAWSSCIYIHPLPRLLHLYKYHETLELTSFFCELMHSFIQTYRLDMDQFDLILPIPLHPARYRQRGFNQSFMIAKRISQIYQKPIHSRLLLRGANTLSQTQCLLKERWTNVTGAFKIAQSTKISGRSILLIDDLITTGATASAAASALKSKGAKNVALLTLAITP